MAFSLRNLLKKLQGGVDAIRKPLPPPVQIARPRNASARVQKAYNQSQPFVQAAQQAYQRQPVQRARQAYRTATISPKRTIAYGLNKKLLDEKNYPTPPTFKAAFQQYPQNFKANARKIYENQVAPTSRIAQSMINRQPISRADLESAGNQAIGFAPVVGSVRGIGRKAPKTPKIDRTKLTGKALDYTNEELARGVIPKRKSLPKGRLSQRLPKAQTRQSLLNETPETLKFQTSKQESILPQSSSAPYDNPSRKLASGQTVDLNPALLRKRESLIKELQTESFTPEKVTDVKQKVGIQDKFKSPTEVYEKIGQGKAAEALRLSDIKTQREIPEHITQIQDWVKRAGDRQEQVFDALDGKKVALTPDEQVIVREVQDYLSTWADRLGLPKDRQITNYITHIFEPDLIKKEFDPDLAKLITGKVPGSVYDPFLQERLGALGYKKDLGLALQAYAKRGVRKANFDPVLKVLKDRSKGMELSQVNYIKKNLERINLRPTEIDNSIDNFIKSTPVGYKFGQRPTMRLTQALRRMGYRGGLGANIGSALKNLTQGVNTYSKLGEKYTTIGYFSALKPGARKELEQAGVLASSFIDDANVGVYKTLLKKMDDVLFYAFEKAEQINRGAAYFGAKQKALDAGKSLDDAVLEGLKTARETQFTFGTVDTPEILSSDLAKTFGQFQSFNLKQAEFIKNMIKNKEYAGMLRWIAANALIVGTVGKVIGFDDWKDVVPFSGVITGETKLGQTPAISALTTSVKYAAGGTDKYGQPLDIGDVGKSLVPIIPGGVQAKKTIEGIDAYSRGASVTPSGKPRYDIEQTPANLLRTATFGQYSVPEARKYFKDPKSVNVTNLQPTLSVTKDGKIKVKGEVAPGILERTKEKFFPEKPQAKRVAAETKALLEKGEISPETATQRIKQAVLQDLTLKVNKNPKAAEALSPVLAVQLGKSFASDMKSVAKDYTLTEKEKVEKMKELAKNFKAAMNKLNIKADQIKPQSSRGTKNILSSLGPITAFGSPLWKPGLDIDLKIGDPVPSPVSGTVVASGPRGGFGNQVAVQGDDGRIWLFSHLARGIAPGQRVAAGQVIGLGGNTGNTIPGLGSDGSHLDVTVVENGRLATAQRVAQLLQSFA